MPITTSTECNELINNLNIEILISGYQQAGVEWRKSRTLPPHYSKLYYILDGDAYIDYGGRRHMLLPGHVYLIPTDLVYDNGCKSFIDFLYFNIRLIDKSGCDYLADCPEMLSAEMSIKYITDLIGKYVSKEPIEHLLVKSAVNATVFHLLYDSKDANFTIRRYSQCVTHALEYINEHLSIRLTLDEICKNVYTARSTLNKRFTNEVGIPIGTYIDNEIMTRCEQLLIDTDLTIGQISERFGFCDQFYFSRRFKEKFGETPNRYRKARTM